MQVAHSAAQVAELRVVKKRNRRGERVRALLGLRAVALHVVVHAAEADLALAHAFAARDRARKAGVSTLYLSLSMTEVYNESVRILIGGSSESAADTDVGAMSTSSPRSSTGTRTRASSGSFTEIETGCANKGHSSGLVALESLEHAMSLLTAGNERRVTGRTDMNARSSRSHLIMTIHAKSVS